MVTPSTNVQVPGSITGDDRAFFGRFSNVPLGKLTSDQAARVLAIAWHLPRTTWAQGLQLLREGRARRSAKAADGFVIAMIVPDDIFRLPATQIRLHGRRLARAE